MDEAERKSAILLANLWLDMTHSSRDAHMGSQIKGN
jgi:hypothetical protein